MGREYLGVFGSEREKRTSKGISETRSTPNMPQKAECCGKENGKGGVQLINFRKVEIGVGHQKKATKKSLHSKG